MPRHPVKDCWRQPEFQKKTGSTLLRLANLAEPKRDNAAVEMVNLLGDLWRNGEPRFQVAEEDASSHLHLYGKAETLPDRKIGDITDTGTDALAVTRHAIDLRTKITR